MQIIDETERMKPVDETGVCVRQMHRYIRTATCGAVLGLSACSTDKSIAPVAQSDMYASLQLDDRAVTMALSPPYDTVHVHARALLGDGAPVPGTIEYSGSDSTIVVDPSGLVTAKFVTTSPSFVRASLKYKGLTRVDSIPVRVVATAPVARPAAIYLRPFPGSDAVTTVWSRDFFGTAGPGQMQLDFGVLDASNAPVPNVLVDFQSANALIAQINSAGLVTGTRLGTTTLSVSTLAYGVHLRDTLSFSVSREQFFEVTLIADTSHGLSSATVRWSVDTVRIGVGGMVMWTNLEPLPIDVVFDNPANVEPAATYPIFGLPDTGPGSTDTFFVDPAIPLPTDFFERLVYVFSHQSRARSFPVVGAYPYHSSLRDVHGVILVCRLSDPCKS